MFTANRSLFAPLAVLIFMVAARAEGILDHVPPSAMGFVVIHDLKGADAKIEQVMAIFGELSDVRPPAPLAFIKAATGLGAGINESGDALLVALPGDASPLEPKPLLMVAVSDYAAFATSVGGDSSGEIARVKIAGQEVLAAKVGDYAMLMNVEHRPTMETLLGVKAESPATIAELAAWLGTNDAALVVLPAGVELLIASAQSAASAQASQFDEQLSDPAMTDMLAEAKRSLAIYQKILGMLNTEIAGVGVGVAIDGDTNVRLTKRLTFKPGGNLADTAPIAKVEDALLAGYPDQPFVFAGGGPFPSGWGESMAKLSRSMIEQAPEIYGFEKFDEAKWQKLEDSWKGAFQVESMSMVMFTGGKDDPLYGNLYGTMRMPNSDQYMDAARKSMEQWNELTEASSSDVKLTYEIAEVDIAGKKALKMTNDVLAAAGDDDVPMMKPMFEKMFGNDGKLVMFWTPTDEHTVVMAISSEEQAKESAGWTASSESGLAENAQVKATTKLLNPAAPWTMYVSPQGCVAWVSRFYTMLMGTIGGPAFTVPEYPAGPPVGISVAIGEGQLQGELVFPVQMLKDVAGYVKKVQGDE
jgi:hypothetical protein